jgi:hypothetical protein
MTEIDVTSGDLNSSLVYGPTGGYLPLGKDCAMRSCNDLRTITATAGKVLGLLGKSKDIEIQLIGTLSSSQDNYLKILDHTGDFPCLDEVIRRLDNTEIIDLKHWEWLDQDHVYLVYGPGDGITTL